MADTKFIAKEPKSFEVEQEFPVRGPATYIDELVTGFYAMAFYPPAFYTGHSAFDITTAIVHVQPSRPLPRPHTMQKNFAVRK